MIDSEKQIMLRIMEKYRNDEEYRRMVNSTDLSQLSKFEQSALAGMLVTDDGIEIVASDLSNHYDPYNEINLETDYDTRITCANMAVASLLHEIFKDSNIDKWPEFDLRSIKTRIKGDLISTLDKPTIIEFIKFYNSKFPSYLPNKAKDFYNILKGHIKNGIGTNTFKSLAMTFNTNIYLEEIIQEEKEHIYRKKR